MRVKCPSCAHTHDLSTKEVLDYITTNKRMLKAVKSLVASLNGKKAKHTSKAPNWGPEEARKASKARWRTHAYIESPKLELKEGRRVRFKKAARGLPAGLYQIQGGEFVCCLDVTPNV